ncbi:hypothetical protein [Actinophytocola glycyrrhizae]|uniref:DUF4350 domain-containing protein n=1 Tax=Actinophytocola glycyrrhizae TaxID=2044873 RepID=A0ABV9RS58_9PSEU
MSRVKKFLATPFGLAAVALLVLAGWATWTAGIFDGPVAEEVRSSSVYVAPGVDVDKAAAERIIGNRRLVVVFLERDADLAQGCDDTSGAADGTLVLLLSPGGITDDPEFDTYGCAHFPGGDDENFGKAFVAETQIAGGADQFADRPLEALRVIAVNYDGLVKAGIVPDGARTISPSLPRYLVAVAAVVAVLGGAVTMYVVGRRAGRLAAGHRAERDSAADARGSLNAKAAVLAKQIIDLDGRFPRADKDFRQKYQRLAADYAELAADLTDGDAQPALLPKVEALSTRARDLAAGPKRRRGKK